MAAPRTALIIGGGVAGPALAIALERAGISSAIYEAYATTADGVGAILSLAPNGLEALRLIGIDLDAIGYPVPRIVMGNGTGKRFGAFSGLPGLPSSRVMWRTDLYRALTDQAAARGIAVHYGKRLVRTHQTSDDITAYFADGSTATADVLIGADGIRSTVRMLIDPSAPTPRYVGHIGFGGLVDGRAYGDPDTMYFNFGEKAFLGHWTQPDGSTVWFANLPHDTPLTSAEARAIPADEWLTRLREVFANDTPGRELVSLTSSDHFLVAGASEILPSVPHWHRGRMVLVGDAAHAPSSSSGQGASLAAESAIELALCLRDIPDLGAAFAEYERRRRPRVEKVAAMAAKQNGRKVSGPIAKALMSVLMPIAMKTVITPEKMFGWMHTYRIDWNAVVTPGA